MSKIKVMIIDDDFYVREALEMLIRKFPKTTVTKTAGSPDEATEVIGSLSKTDIPDVILLDINFVNSSLTGIDMIKGLKKLLPEVKILISSIQKEENQIIEAITNGADGYVWKNESGVGIVGAIDKVVSGRFVVTKSVAEMIMGKTNELKDYSVEIMPDNMEYRKMTDQLQQTVYLYCFAGLSAKEIADELCLSVHTINSRIKTVYQMLQATNRSEAFERLISNWKD